MKTFSGVNRESDINSVLPAVLLKEAEIINQEATKTLSQKSNYKKLKNFVFKKLISEIFRQYFNPAGSDKAEDDVKKIEQSQTYNHHSTKETNKRC